MRRQYQYFAKRINLQTQKIWYSLVKDELCTELLRLRNSLEESYSIALSLAKNPDGVVHDVLAALHAKDDARLSIIQLICQGTEMIINMQQQQQPKYHKSQSNIMMQNQPHP